MRLILLCTIAFTVSVAALCAQETAPIRTADGFQCPVGPNGSGEGYYIARGYMPNGHLGDDWNGIKGGDTDMGDPVYATAYGLVVFAKNYHVGWGNVVILRHAFYEGSTLKYVDSLYGHLNDFNVHEGQQVRRGQLIGHIGNNNGMYDAHLHFEMRKNLNIGMYRGSFPRDFTNYYSPNRFIASHLTCPRGDKIVEAPINTFPANAPPSYVAAKVSTPVYSPGTAPADHLPPPGAALANRTAREPAPEPKVVTTPPSPKVVVSSDGPKDAPSTPAKSSAATSASSRKTADSSASKGGTTAAASSKPAAATSSSGKPTASAASGKKGQGTTADKKPASPPVVAKRTEESDPSPAESAPPKPGKPLALENDTSEPPAPAPTGSPIRRGPAAFRVDRFPDLRGLGY